MLTHTHTHIHTYTYTHTWLFKTAKGKFCFQMRIWTLGFSFVCEGTDLYVGHTVGVTLLASCSKASKGWGKTVPSLHIHACVCVCVCMCKRERERVKKIKSSLNRHCEHWIKTWDEWLIVEQNCPSKVWCPSTLSISICKIQFNKTLIDCKTHVFRIKK